VPTVPQTKAGWTNGVDALSSTNLNAYLRDPVRFMMNAPVARLVQTVAQSIASGGSFTPLTFTTELEDTDPDGLGGHSTASNTSRYTCRYPGVYLLGGGAGFAVNATGGRGCAWMLNGSVLDGTDVMANAVTVASTATRISARPWLVRLAETDYVELGVFHNAGAALNTALGSAASSMSVAWLRL